ncbi:uncharacterized protein [Argopecten irradians]|uniref:uncharacterized protein n=1 Tax=Argopecten irradians TaxID=31199 RepID=UPI00371AE873
MWRILPFITGLLLFVYFPIFLLRICSAVYDWIHFGKGRHHSKNGEDGEELYLLKSATETKPKEWISFNPISLWWIISQPIRRVCDNMPRTGSRLCRLVFALLSLSVIIVKITLHGIYQTDFVVASVRQGSPMDFLSVLAGHDLAKDNFLSDFGGPFIALGLYIVGAILFLCVPNNLSKELARGLPQNSGKGTSLTPLSISVGDRQRLTYSNIEDSNGYDQLSSAMVKNFFMLLNPSFTGYVFKIQLRRLQAMLSYFTVNGNCIICVLFVALLPCYLIVCLVEMAICIVFYGMPILFFMFVILRGYCLGAWNRVRTHHICYKCLVLLFIPLLITSLTYVIYVLNIVFVDSFLFLSRVVIFTYTGLFAYTTQSSGYFVLYITVIMYIGDSIQKLKTEYTNIFNNVLELCKIYAEKHGTDKVYSIVDDVACMPSDLFMSVVNRYQPLRVQLFKAILKITIISIVLYLSVELLVSFEKFKELQTLTQAITTLFVCSVPKIINSTCKKDKSRWHQKWKRELSRFINDFCRELDVISISDNHNDCVLIDTL